MFVFLGDSLNYCWSCTEDQCTKKKFLGNWVHWINCFLWLVVSVEVTLLSTTTLFVSLHGTSRFVLSWTVNCLLSFVFLRLGFNKYGHFLGFFNTVFTTRAFLFVTLDTPGNIEYITAIFLYISNKMFAAGSAVYIKFLAFAWYNFHSLLFFVVAAVVLQAAALKLMKIALFVTTHPFPTTLRFLE